jgi:hypothetical protein
MKKKKQLETGRDQIYQNITKGAYVRSKANWIEKGEKNTPYFLRLERQTQSLNVIHEIKTENNTIVKSTSDILSNMCTYYETF